MTSAFSKGGNHHDFNTTPRGNSLAAPVCAMASLAWPATEEALRWVSKRLRNFVTWRCRTLDAPRRPGAPPRTISQTSLLVPAHFDNPSLSSSRSQLLTGTSHHRPSNTKATAKPRTTLRCLVSRHHDALRGPPVTTCLSDCRPNVVRIAFEVIHICALCHILRHPLRFSLSC